MAPEDKSIRTVRGRNEQSPSMLGRLFLAVGNQGGDVGEVRLIQESHQSTIRDIIVFTDDEEQEGRVLETVAFNSRSQVLEVCDEVLELHQKEESLSEATMHTVTQTSMEQSLARTDNLRYAEKHP